MVHAVGVDGQGEAVAMAQEAVQVDVGDLLWSLPAGRASGAEPAGSAAGDLLQLAGYLEETTNDDL